jgi:hypothetical protein
MSRLILHIGTHKTATTTLQRHLARNRKTLAERGIWYPDYDLIGIGRHYAHLGIVNAFSGKHEKYSVEDARHFFREVSARVRDHEATIISGEPFYRHIVYDKPGRLQDPDVYWPLREAYIAQVREAFGEVPVEIAVVFRRQVDYAPSLYQEQIKVTRYTQDFATFRREFWYHFDYLGQARAWARVFQTLHPMRFEDLIAGGDPVAPFGKLLALDLSGPETVAQQNVSMHPDAVVLKRMLHAIKIDKDVLRADIEAMLEGPLRQKIQKFRNRSLYANAEDMKAFHQSFRRDNDYLGREFFPGFAPGSDLFSDRLNTDLRFGDTLHPYFLNILLQELKNARRQSPTSEDRK